MKKFYIPIFTVFFLLTSFLTQAQTVYNSITDNNPPSLLGPWMIAAISG